MRFIADENVPASAVSALSAAGHDVKWVHKNAPSVQSLYQLVDSLWVA